MDLADSYADAGEAFAIGEGPPLQTLGRSGCPLPA
jgi:hypothetical protein